MQLLFIYLFFNNSLLTPDFLFLKYQKLDRLAQWSGCGTHLLCVLTRVELEGKALH